MHRTSGASIALVLLGVFFLVLGASVSITTPSGWAVPFNVYLVGFGFLLIAVAPFTMKKNGRNNGR